MNTTKDLTIEQVETADNVLRRMIHDERAELEMFPKSQLARIELDAMYMVQSRLVGILEDKRMMRGPT